MKIIMKSNPLRLKLAYSLRKKGRADKKNIWKDASESLLSSGKNRPKVNVGEISRNTKDGSKVLVAGKVLGGGLLNHKVTVAAYSFSESAKAKIVSSGGKCLSLPEFAESGDVKDVVVLG